MLARRVLSVVAVAAAWLACDDRSVELASVGQGHGGSGVGGSADMGGNAARGGSGGSGGAGGLSGPTGTTGVEPCPSRGCSGTGGGGSTTFNNGGAGPANTTAAFAGAPGFGEAGATYCASPNDPCCNHPEYSRCTACLYAATACGVPTPDCQDFDSDWEEVWRRTCSKRQDACGPGRYCRNGWTCFEPTSTCKPPCTGEFACGYGVCNSGACVECANDDSCFDPNRPYCLAGNCVQCKGVEDCANALYCVAGLCQPCMTGWDCIQQFGDDLKHCVPDPLTFRNRCVECVSPGDCPDGYNCSFNTCVRF